MKKNLKIGIIGDYNPASATHKATDAAIAHTAAWLNCQAEVVWIPTPALVDQVADALQPFDALCCAPGSPYQSMAGALNGIHFARSQNRPFLGT